MSGEALDNRSLVISVVVSTLLAVLVGLGGLLMGSPYTATDAAGAAFFSFVLGMIVAVSLVPRLMNR